MRIGDEEYSIGDLLINKSSKERFVVVDLIMCQDSYFDKLYVISESEYLSSKGLSVSEEELDTFDIIYGDELHCYEWVKLKYCDIECQTSYCIGYKSINSRISLNLLDYEVNILRTLCKEYRAGLFSNQEEDIVECLRNKLERLSM